MNKNIIYSTKKEILHNIFIILFLSIIATPLLIAILHIDIKSVDLAENRKLASFPQYKNIKQYNNDLEKYVNDHIPLRSYIIGMYHYLWTDKLYSPVFRFINGKNNHIFHKLDVIKYLGLREYPKYNYNEIYNGMSYIAKYYNIPFLFILVPDKESVLFEQLPNWQIEFQEKHNRLSLREYLLSQLDHTSFSFIDMYDIFKNNPNIFFNKRYDIFHYNGNGLEYTINEIKKIAILNNVDLSNVDKFYEKIEVDYKVFPYINPKASESVVRLKMSDDFFNIQHFHDNTFKKNRWTNPDHVLNNNIDKYSLLLLSDSSLKSKFIANTRQILKSNANLTPFLFTTHNYVQTFNKDYITYDFYTNYIHKYKPDIIIYQITERTLDESVPNDSIFNIIGRYAIGKNEYFIFPEYLTDKPEYPIETTVKQIINNEFTNISKNLKTDSNGDISISFRYIAPKTTVAALQYSQDKNFNNYKELSEKIGGGEDDTVTFYIKTKPNTPIYARFSAGKIKGEYKFLEIKELRGSK